MATRRTHPITHTGERLARLVELFMSEHLVFMKGEYAGRPFLLEPWQRERIIRPLFGTVDAKGNRIYREAVIGLPRDGGKSELAAAIALACMFTEPVYEGEYVVVARNHKQAGIVFNKARRMVLRDPELRAACEVRKAEIVIRDTGARFYTVPWDAGSAQGIHATVCVIDEYHVHRNDSMRYAMLSGMIAQPNALLITISTAGAERKGPLWDLLLSAPKDPRAYVYWAGAADGDDMHDPKVWRRATPQSWITLRMLRDAHRTLPSWDFERYHLNRFPAKGVHRAFSATDWDAQAGVPVIDPKRPSVIGVDASFRRDTTAIVLDQVDTQGFHNVRSWIFGSQDGEPIDRPAVMATIVDLCRENYVERVVCDPNYFVLEMMQLVNDFGIPIEEYPQNNSRMAKASDALFKLISEKRLRHGGEPRLREQVLNAGMQPTPYGWRLTKIEDDKKIDAAVALSMAAFIAETAHIEDGAGPQIVVF
jgi:phage terminase large subunit-like protein